jgi:hypothetical protein
MRGSTRFFVTHRNIGHIEIFANKAFENYVF